MIDEQAISRSFHDLRNTLGSVLLNLEVAIDSRCDATMQRAAAADALAEARKIDAALGELRLLMARKKEEEGSHDDHFVDDSVLAGEHCTVMPVAVRPVAREPRQPGGSDRDPEVLAAPLRSRRRSLEVAVIVAVDRGVAADDEMRGRLDEEVVEVIALRP